LTCPIQPDTDFAPHTQPKGKTWSADTRSWILLGPYVLQYEIDQQELIVTLAGIAKVDEDTSSIDNPDHVRCKCASSQTLQTGNPQLRSDGIWTSRNSLSKCEDNSSVGVMTSKWNVGSRTADNTRFQKVVILLCTHVCEKGQSSQRQRKLRSARKWKAKKSPAVSVGRFRLGG
jgi:hypothetical protein